MLKQISEEHRYLIKLASKEAGITSPVVVLVDDESHFGLSNNIFKKATKGKMIPIKGVLIRNIDVSKSQFNKLSYGIRLYKIQDICFARVLFQCYGRFKWDVSFVVIDKKHYLKFCRIIRSTYGNDRTIKEPILSESHREILWHNTIQFLERSSLPQIRKYGGCAHRGILLTGSPGNGKTLTCRWLWNECRRRGWQWQMITPDNLREIRACQQMDSLLDNIHRGIIFFDDMDLAMRNRETVRETEDQLMFLTALDGIKSKKELVFIFTTNCSLDLIDPAFKRPGRIDLSLEFEPPDAGLRRQLIQGWQGDIITQLDVEKVVRATSGLSFAEIEELKNLLIMHYIDKNVWDFDWAIRQFKVNRADLAQRRNRQPGFKTLVSKNNGE